MAFDVAFVALMALFAVLGLFAGIINQLFRLGALVAIWFYVRFFSSHAATWLEKKRT